MITNPSSNYLAIESLEIDLINDNVHFSLFNMFLSFPNNHSILLKTPTQVHNH